MKYPIVLIFSMLPFILMAQESAHLQLKGTRLMRHIVITDSIGRTFTFDSSFTEVYTDGKLMLYDLTYTYGSSYEDIELIKDEVRHHYFIFAKDSLYGFDLDAYKTKIIQKRQVDSVINKEWSRSDMEKYYKELNFRLIASQTDRNDLHERYLVTSKKDTSLSVGTCFFDYTKYVSGSFNMPLQSLEEKKGMYVSGMQMLTESCLGKVDVKYKQEEIIGINENIFQFFANYHKITFHAENFH